MIDFKIIIVLLIILCISQIFILNLLVSMLPKQNDKKLDKKILDGCSNRTQKRMMEKQLSIFKEKFSKFNNYQLNAIRELIEDIQKDRL